MKSFYMTTQSGVQFDLTYPEKTEIHIRDIAHSLARLCRFNGHTINLYSVAQHSVHVSELVALTNPEFALDALLHDAHEAYLGDLCGPIKEYLRYFSGDDQPCQWDRLEAAFQTRIVEVFELTSPEPSIVHEVDKRILSAEATWQMPHQKWSLNRPTVQLRATHCWNEMEAARRFLDRFEYLAGVREAKRGAAG